MDYFWTITLEIKPKQAEISRNDKIKNTVYKTVIFSFLDGIFISLLLYILNSETTTFFIYIWTNFGLITLKIYLPEQPKYKFIPKILFFEIFTFSTTFIFGQICPTELFNVLKICSHTISLITEIKAFILFCISFHHRSNSPFYHLLKYVSKYFFLILTAYNLNLNFLFYQMQSLI